MNLKHDFTVLIIFHLKVWVKVVMQCSLGRTCVIWLKSVALMKQQTGTGVLVIKFSFCKKCPALLKEVKLWRSIFVSCPVSIFGSEDTSVPWPGLGLRNRRGFVSRIKCSDILELAEVPPHLHSCHCQNVLCFQIQTDSLSFIESNSFF